MKEYRRRTAKNTLRNTASASSTSFWEFINSSFGVFLFSSVFLGLLSFSYGQWRDRATKAKRAEQLEIEVALRIQAMDTMASSVDNIRYSNLVNIAKVLDGDPKASFYVRKPLFNEFDNKNLTSLLWQLYLVVPSSLQREVKGSIRDVDSIAAEIRRVRYVVSTEPEVEHAKPKKKVEQDRQDDEDDKFRKEYGQRDIYQRIHALSQNPRWKNVIE